MEHLQSKFAEVWEFEVEKLKNSKKKELKVDFLLKIDYKNHVLSKKKNFFSYFEKENYSALFGMKFIILGQKVSKLYLAPGKVKSYQKFKLKSCLSSF